jgi:inosose dehydratase
MIKIANAPCSWGALEFDLQGKPATYDIVLDEIHKTGYVGTELGDWGFMPTNPAVLKDELQKRELKLLGAFVPVALKDAARHADGEARAVKIAHLLADVQGDLPFIVLADDNGSVLQRTQNAGRVTPDMGLSEADWLVAAAGVERIARAVKQETGLRLVVHHHCAGYVETPDEIENCFHSRTPNWWAYAWIPGTTSLLGEIRSSSCKNMPSAPGISILRIATQLLRSSRVMKNGIISSQWKRASFAN